MSLLRYRSIALLVTLVMCLTGWFAAAEAAPPPTYGKLPLSFEANHGQTDPSVDFVARSTGYQLFLTRDEAVLVLRRPGAAAADALRMTLVDAVPARPHGIDRLPGEVNYLLGNDPAKWRTSIPTYAKVLAREVYPGVDLVYYGNQRQLEYDFILAPGADPRTIRLAFQGLAASDARQALSLDASGDLTLRVPGGDVRLKRPIAYQENANGDRSPVKVAFALVPAPGTAGSWHVGFEVGAYDRERPLVIDPVLSYAAYLGGSDVDAGMAIAVRDGEAYVTGYTDSLTFPPAGAQPNQPGKDAFVAKLNAAGSGLVYATFLGGDQADAGMGIAVDSSGQAYVTGFTESTNFPTVPASPLFGNQGGRDAFVTKLNATGTGFLYSTYLGGGLEDTGLGIAVDSAGNAYVTGWTDSTDFPTTVSSAFQGDQPERDAFVSKIGSLGTQLLYSTYLGGDGIDEGQAIAVDATGLAHVTGDTTSTNLLTTANTRPPGGGQDAFVAKLDPGASGPASRLYLTYFGGSAADAGRGIAVDSLGFIHITGVTSSANLVTKFPYQTTHGGGQDAFVAKFNAAGAGPNAALMYSSFLGGTGDDAGHAIALDTEDQAYVTGVTASADFPLLHAMDSGLGGAKDAFVAKFDPADPGLPSLRYSTYLGGSGEDEGYGIAVDATGSAYVVGLTRSGDFPGTVGSLSGPEDAFVAKLGEPDLTVPVFTVPATGGEGQVITVTDTTRNQGVATAPASTTAFYLSTDNKLDPTNDTFLGSRLVPELAPGAEHTVDTQLTLPTPLPPAGYFLFAKADTEDEIGEAFESNNRTRRNIAVGSDLTVTVVTVTSTGTTLTVTDTTRNIGGATIGATTTKFVLVPAGGGEVLLGNRAVASLAAGTESSASTDVQLPAGTTGGNYTVVARADADAAVTETNETNNDKSTPFVVGVDLIVSALTVPGTSGAGSSISVTATVQNKGAVASTQSTTEFFLSTTTSIDGTAVSIGSQSVPALAPGATSAVAKSLTIPANTAPGSYFVIAKANGISPIAETSTTNNTRARSTVVGPDLTISFVSPASATSGPGKNVTIKDSTKNTGGGNAAASVTKFHLSTDAIFDGADVELGQRSVPALAAGADHFNAAGVVLTIPANTAAGSYFIIIRANAGTTPIGEVNTTNNTSTVPLTVSGADLVVSVLNVSLSGTSTLSITDTTKNQGTAAAAATITRFHFSTDGTFDEATDPVLGERAVPALAANALSEATTSVTLPAGTTPGLYTIFARSDATSVVAESDESNNRRARTIDTRGSDLIITTVVFSFGSGATVNVSETTRNEGPATAGASQTRFFLSTDATFGAGDVPIGVRNVVSLAAASQSTATTPVSIPGTTAPGDYFLIARADDANVVGEVDETNNTASTPISLKADLVVPSLTVPSAATAGTPITASGTIRNDGPIPAGASVLKLYLSTDATLDTSTDTVLGTQAFTGVGAAQTENFSIQITIPAGTAGNMFVIAKVDADSQVTESDETNNTRNKAIAVGPDLIISVFSGVPAAAGVGSTFTINDTTRNLAAADVGASTTAFYLSTDDVFDPADVQLGSRAVPALGARRTSPGSTQVTIPAGTASGNYFVIAVADAGQAHTEASETNNTASSAIVIGSDLVISAVSAPGSAGAGVTITVTDTTTNQGGAVAGASTTKLYLSTNTTFEAGDVLLGTGRAISALAAGAGSSGSTDVVIPAGTTGGTYFIIARADADGDVNEVSEVNNTKATGPIVLGTDLVVSSLSVPLTTGAGATINVTETVTNTGGTGAGESVVKLYLSTDTVVDGGDTLLGTRLVPALAPGASSEGVTQVTIPVDTSSGVFFLIAQADGNAQVEEVNETNNTASAQLKTGPDLQVTVLNVPPEAASGALMNIRDTTKNQGAASVASVTRFFLSTDDILDVNVDTLLASRNVPALNFGASSAGNFDVPLPAGLTAGTYFIIALADATNTNAEALEDNNTRSRAVNIGPDYVISGVTAPAEGGAGLAITVGASTKNQGAAGAATITQFFLSSNGTLSGGEPLLGSRQVPALGAGNINTGSISVTLPANIAPGPYFIVAKANGDGAVSETITTNNTKARAITIGPDLVVSALTVPTPVGAAIPFTVSDTTRNDGAGSTAQSVTSFFLSINNFLDPPDIFLGSRTVPALAPGASSTASTSLTIPDGTPGGTYLIIARANETNAVAELHTDNNERFKQTKVGPDLVVSTLTGPTSATAGSTITLNETTTNQGAGNAATFTVRVYLSVNDEVFDPAVDQEVGNRVIGGLAPGAASSGPISITIPGGTTAGSYVLFAVADADNVVSEVVETNNNKQKSLNVTP